MCHPDWFNESNAQNAQLMDGIFSSLGHISCHVVKEAEIEAETLQKLMEFQVLKVFRTVPAGQ